MIPTRIAAQKYKICRVFFLAIFLITLGWLEPENCQALQDRSLFLDTSMVDLRSTRDFPGAAVLYSTKALRSRPVKINLEYFQKQSFDKFPDLLAVHLFEDAFFTLSVTGTSTTASGTRIVQGKILEDKLGYFILASHNGIFSGNFFFLSQRYRLRWVGQDTYLIQQVDSDRFSSEIPSISVFARDLLSDREGEVSGDRTTSTRIADDGSQLDLLVAYTDDARVAAGGTSSIISQIELVVAETNQTFLNSGITTSIRLIHTMEVNYNESGDLQATLDELTDGSDGIIDEVHTMRNIYRADMACLWVESSNMECGISWQMTAVLNSFKSMAFCVVDRECATDNFSMAHELGHIMGARNDRFVDSTQGSPFMFNHGYVFTPDLWRTIMTQNEQCHTLGISCLRIPHWSNPDVNYMNEPTGIQQGLSDSADNRETLNRTALTVSNFRESVTTVTMIIDSGPNGQGAGTVTSSDNGISCGGDCNETYSAGDPYEITLTASPNAGSQFAGWFDESDQLLSINISYQLTLDQDHVITASFLKEHNIEVVLNEGPDGNGMGSVTTADSLIDCGTICSQIYTAGDEVTFTATADTGSVFSGWTGDGCGGSNPCTITVDSDLTLTATFTKLYTVTVLKDGGFGDSGKGTVVEDSGLINCGNLCSTSLEVGTPITFSATPELGSRFAGYSGASCDQQPDCTITVSQDTTVTANFVRQYNLLINPHGGPDGKGSGTISDTSQNIGCSANCLFPVDAGTDLVLDVAAATDSRFDDWLDSHCAGMNPCSVTMDMDRTVQPRFIRQYTLTTEKDGGAGDLGSGTVTGTPGNIDCGSTCSQTVDTGTEIELTANADSGSVFIGWSGWECDGVSTCTVKMDTDKTVTANFKRQFTLEVIKDLGPSGMASGTVTSSPAGIDCGSQCTQTMDAGTKVSLSLAADTGSTLTGWSGAGISCPGTGPCSITMDSDKTVTANLAKLFTLTVAPDAQSTGGGTVVSSPAGISCGQTCQAIFPETASITLAATADSESTFAGWTSGGCGGTGNCKPTLSSDLTVNYRFTINPPVADFEVFSVKGVTAPLTVTFLDESLNSPTSWLWDFDDGNTSNEQNPTHTYTQPGSYKVSLIVTNASGSDDSSTSYSINVSNYCIIEDVLIDPQPYPSLQVGFNKSVNTDVLKCHNYRLPLPPGFEFDQPKSVDLEGGFLCEYPDSPRGRTILDQMTVSDGTIFINRFTISGGTLEMKSGLAIVQDLIIQ